ncbi:hypothetical protein, partial [Neisseria cinerea]|uniref:hypothetical protein n=1 Tax=Neisseria cinerea TaxID=483 RepID=UPI002B1D87AF
MPSENFSDGILSFKEAEALQKERTVLIYDKYQDVFLMLLMLFLLKLEGLSLIYILCCRPTV